MDYTKGVTSYEKNVKPVIRAVLIASTMAMSMTACSGASAENNETVRNSGNRKATETESESETAEAKRV